MEVAVIFSTVFEMSSLKSTEIKRNRTQEVYRNQLKEAEPLADQKNLGGG